MSNKKNLAVVEKKELTISERFTNAMVQEFKSGVGAVALTDFQQRLAQNYFVAIDTALKTAEQARLKKTGKWQDPVPVTWNNINMQELARDLVSYARIGLDPAQKNHINMIPFKNNNTQKYDIGFIEGYRGIQLKAEKYGLDVPSAVIVELVYSNDKFRQIKKDFRNEYDSYEFEITNPFDRGEIIGGFYYHHFESNPKKNKIVVMSIEDILKRKPARASVEFWGGEKDIWENGKKVGKKQVEGWYERMCYKTVYRAAYNDITIDSQKIDSDYLRVRQLETQYAENVAIAEIEENANMEELDFDDETGEIIEGESEVVYEEGPEIISDGDDGQLEMEGPGY